MNEEERNYTADVVIMITAINEAVARKKLHELLKRVPLELHTDYFILNTKEMK